jgi:hypothetical protein
VETYKQTSAEKIPAGKVTVKMLFETDKPQPGSGGTVTLWANERQIGQGTMPHTVPIAFSTYARMDMGVITAWWSTAQDKAPYPFTGTAKKVVLDLKPAAHEDEKALHEHAQVQAVGQGAAD